MLPRLWGSGKFKDIDFKFLSYLKSLGVDFLWLTGIPRHASGKPFVKGNPGSPYSICDYYDVNPYLADEESRRMEEFRGLVARVHASGLKLMTDFVPNHVSCDYSDTHGGIPVLDYCDYDWTDTRKIDYSDSRTVSSLADILRFWASMGVDGFRCDMVELVGAQNMGRMIMDVRSSFPSLIFVAEVYNTGNYRQFVEEGGFDLLYDKSGSYDILRGIIAGHASTAGITDNWQRLGDLQPHMLNFLENHDEQRLASRAFAASASNAYAALAVSALFNSSSMMLYAGQELGEDAAEASDCRTSIFNIVSPSSLVKLRSFLDGKTLEPEDAKILERYRSVMEIAGSPLGRKGCNWDLQYCNIGRNGFDPYRHFAFLRYDSKDCLLFFCNFSDKPAAADIFVPVRCSGCYHMEAAARDFSVLKL